MPYATQADLAARFGTQQLLQIADRDGDDVLDAAVVDAALADADAEIDSYIGLRYELPLASTPPRLRDIAIDVAMYKLHPAGTPEDVLQRYRDAVKWLNELSKGNVLIDVGGEEPAAAPDQAEFVGPERVFSRDTLGNY